MEKADSLIKAILIITSMFTLVAVFVIAFVLYFNKRKRMLIARNQAMEKEFQAQLQEAQTEVQEHTLQNLSRELHDNVGQLLSTSVMLLGVTERQLAVVPDPLKTAHATLSKAIQELRALSKSMDREWLEQFSLVDNLRMEVERLRSGRFIDAHFSSPEAIPLSREKQILLFRIVQEAMQNALKHAHPQTIRVLIDQNSKGLLITVTDDGEGIGAPGGGEGSGLRNMKARARLLGGSIEWKALPEKGTGVYIQLPIAP